MGVYLIVIGKTAAGHSDHCPDEPGCVSVGKSVEGVVANSFLLLNFYARCGEDFERRPLAPREDKPLAEREVYIAARPR